ncbi:MAG: hypothetical protein JRI23_16325 [Deltaproteobacteria bacterium]|jgi:hypothetical protein|nr:hypothetical protein [Deltaproteobacteria bacterium]MBW2533338.1 hypothetical protein [Deltaproteobacteria bacterium]
MAREDEGPEIEVADHGTEVMGPDSAADRSSPVDPEDNPVVAETRRIRADEVVTGPALPFGEARVAPQAVVAIPGAARRQPDPDAPEALTEEVHVRPADRKSLPFQAPLERAPRGPTPEELDELVWRSKVGIDPSDLPSAQLVVPPSERAGGAGVTDTNGRGTKLGLLVLGLALLVGFLVAALAMTLR